MSRHHILPPIVYTPPPPKKAELRRSRRIQSRRISSASDNEETGETLILDAPGNPSTPAERGPLAPIAKREGQTQQSGGKLSENTLKTMLQAQEQTTTAGAAHRAVTTRSG